MLISAGPRVAATGQILREGPLVDLRPRAVAGVQELPLNQLIYFFSIDFNSLTLLDDFTIPLQAKVFEDSGVLAQIAGLRALSVEVFQTQIPAPTAVFGVTITADGGEQRAPVQGARWGGGKASLNDSGRRDRRIAFLYAHAALGLQWIRWQRGGPLGV